MGEKKLIIVCDSKTISYANYLKQLLTTKDDEDDKIIGVKDGSVTVVIWLEKDYIANRPTISSNAHILFIGNNRTTKEIMKNINMSFSKFGINYGWLGKDLALYVENRMLDEREYEEFIKYTAEYHREFKNCFSIEEWEKLGFVFGWIGYGALHTINRLGVDRQIKKQQYSFAVLHLYLHELSRFLEL